MGLATQHIGNLVNGLRSWLKKPPNREMIHEVRVHLKKLRALWWIHPTGNSIAFRHSFPALYNLFKRAGTYRDLQTTLICIKTLPGFNSDDSIKNLIDKKITEEKEKIKKHLSQASSKHKIYNELNQFHAYYSIAPGFLLRATREHYRTETLILMVAIDGFDDEQLHDLRKRIKNSLYQCEAFPARINHSQPVPSNDILKLLQNQLGNWHDWWFTAFYLQQQKKETEKPQLNKLLEQAEKKTALLKREVMRNLRKHTPAMVSTSVTTMGDKQIILLPQAKRKIARLEKK